MRILSNLSLVLAVTWCLGGAVLAKDGKDDSEGSGGNSGKGKGQTEIPRLGVPKDSNLPDDLKKLIHQYQDAAQKYAADRKELLAQLKGARDEQKQALKDLLSANRQQFLDNTSQVRADILEQLRELRKKLKDSGAGSIEGGGDGKGHGRGGRP